MAKTAILPAGVSAGPQLEGVSEYRLANGLRVVLYPFNDRSETTLAVVYGVGGRDDVPGLTGHAHLLEHMLFKGTPSTPDVARAFRERGMRWNAITSLDATTYFASFAGDDPERLDWLIGLEAERMTQATFTQSDLDVEIAVVRNELDIHMSSPYASVLDAVRASVFHVHPYGRSVIGERSDIDRADLAHLRQMYSRFYRPDNATVLISGRMDVPRVLGRIAATFGQVARPVEKLARRAPSEPTQIGEREASIRRVGGIDLLLLAYRTPAIHHPDQPALDALSFMLSNNPQGALFRKFVEPQTLATAGASAQRLQQQGLLLIYATPGQGQTLTSTRDAVSTFVENGIEAHLTDALFNEFKALTKAGYERVQRDPAALAQGLVESAAVGDWRLWFAWREQMHRLQLDDVKRVARTYLVRANRTSGLYWPEDKPVGVIMSEAPAIEELVSEITERAAIAEGESIQADPQWLEERTSYWRSSAGLKVGVLNRRSRSDSVELSIVFRFGSPGQAARDPYSGQVWELINDAGSVNRDWPVINKELAKLNATLHVSAQSSGVVVTLSAPRESLDAGVRIVADLLRNPAWSQRAFDRLRSASLATFDAGLNDPVQRIPMIYAGVVNRARGLAAGDPGYQYSPSEYFDLIRTMTLDKLVASHARWGTGDVIATAVGPIDAAELAEIVHAAFAGWRKAEPFTDFVEHHVAIPGQRHHARVKDRPNGMLSATRYFPLTNDAADYWPMVLVSSILADGAMDSRLGVRLRAQLGASYSVEGFLSAPDPMHGDAASFNVQATFAPARAVDVLEAIAQEIDLARRDGFTQSELDRFRNDLLQRMREQRQLEASVLYALFEHLTRPGWTWARWAEEDAALRAVTLDQLNAAVRKYVRWQDFVVVTSGEWGEDIGLGALSK